MDTNIKISVLLPAYNGESTIAKSINSVLEQTYNNFELIIINDGSSDNTESIIKSFNDTRIIYIENEKNIGLYESLNKGLLLAKGVFIARIDSDDYWIDEKKLEKQINFFKNNPNCSLLGTQALFSDGTKTHYPTKDEDIRNNILSKNLFIHSSVMFKKISEYPERLVEDYALWLKLGLKGTFANLPDYCVHYLINPEGMTRANNYAPTKSSLELIKRYKGKYPNFYLGYSIWSIKFLIRKFLFHFR